MAASEHALKIAKIAAQAAYDKKAEDIVLLDVSEHLVITDIFLIVSADNERQVGAVVDAIEAALDLIDVDPIRRTPDRHHLCTQFSEQLGRNQISCAMGGVHHYFLSLERQFGIE